MPSSEPQPSNPDDLQRALQDVLPENFAPIIEEEILIEIDESSRSRGGDDHRLLSRFFGMCVLLIGVITILPAVYYWMVMTVPGDMQPVARWACILGFLGGVHFLYAIYTMQIADYSSLESLAAFLLIVTCLYGFTGMALMLEDGTGKVATFLQLPAVLISRATLWSGIMFGITALGCYLFGREAVIWRRRFSGGRARVPASSG